MKYTVLLFGLVAVCPSVFAVPRVVCEKDNFDFGELKADQRVEHRFVLENRGDSPLVLGEVRGCCGASAVVRDRVVPPGSNTVCEVLFGLRGRSGQVQKSIYVESNDPARPHLRLTLAGTVQPVPGAPVIPVAVPLDGTAPSPASPAPPPAALTAVPSLLILSVMEGDRQPLGRFLAVRSTASKPFCITGAELPRAGMAWRVSPLGATAWRVEITGIVPEDALNGTEVRLLTDYEAQPVITIPVRVVTRPRIEAPQP